MALNLLKNRYQIFQELGGGGFGKTFLAKDTHMPSSKKCVIKQLTPITNNTQVYQLVQQRFQQEAAILEELGDCNPQIPRLYAYFSEDSEFYLVQEYIEGQTLSQKLAAEGVLSEMEVKEILRNILLILEYVHSKGIVHRDIKPDNIILRFVDNKPVLIDFGAVKVTMNTVSSASGNSNKSIVIGTPGFMSMEQIVGRPVFSSDLYSLGLTEIYLLTGKVPQDLPTEPTTGNVLWRNFVPSLNVALGDVLDKAISYHPGDRYPTARDMLEALKTPITPSKPPSQIPTVIATPPSQSDPTVIAKPPSVVYPQPETILDPPINQPDIPPQDPTQGLRTWLKFIMIGGFFLLGLVWVGAYAWDIFGGTATRHTMSLELRYQRLYYIEYRKFAKSIDELVGSGVESTIAKDIKYQTFNYNYLIKTKNNPQGHEITYFYGISRNPYLKSYVGAITPISITPISTILKGSEVDKINITEFLCETDSSTQNKPADPYLKKGSVICPKYSHRVFILTSELASLHIPCPADPFPINRPSLCALNRKSHSTPKFFLRRKSLI